MLETKPEIMPLIPAFAKIAVSAAKEQIVALN